MEPEPQTEPEIRVLLVDDHPAVREGLALLLAPEGIAVCCEAGEHAGALACLKANRPDVALVDLSLGGEDGLSLVADLHARGVPALVYSMHEDSRHVEGAFTAGALGYGTKREAHRVLVEAIRETAAGRVFVSPCAAVTLATRFSGATDHAGDRELSEQERQVYSLLSQGEGTIEIAAALEISARTVESYYARIQDKLGLEGMHELRRHAINHLNAPVR
ncbi:MAG TPA: response regulator transcription factor [Armatimonadota bacterium]|jgi:DNA-binding NarL/FixJ family response regulator